MAGRELAIPPHMPEDWAPRPLGRVFSLGLWESPLRQS